MYDKVAADELPSVIVALPAVGAPSELAVPAFARAATLTVPAVIVVDPVYVLATPLSVRAPVAVLLSASEPVSKPAYVSVAELLMVKTAAVPLSVTVPLPVTLATVWANPAKSSVPFTVRAVVLGTALASPSAMVPELMVVAPVYVLATFSVRIPVPLLVKLPEPLMPVVAMVMLPALGAKVTGSPELAMPPVKVRVAAAVAA